MASAGLEQIVRHVGLVGKVDAGFDQRQRLDEFLPPGLGAVTQRAGHLPIGLPALALGFRHYQIGEAFDGGEIELAVLEGAAGEFAGLGGAQILEAGEGGQRRRDHRAAAVQLQFGRVLAGLAVRSGEPQRQRLVDHLAGCRIADAGKGRLARRGDFAGEALSASPARGPEMRMTAIAAGGRPEERAKMVSRAVSDIDGARKRQCADRVKCARSPNPEVHRRRLLLDVGPGEEGRPACRKSKSRSTPPKITSASWADGAALSANDFLDWLAPPAGLRWLDVGCGDRSFQPTRAGPLFAKSVAGIDPAPAQIEHARSQSPDAEFRVADAMALPFAGGEFDIVASALVINFIPDRAKALAEMCRVLRPGGVVAGYVWHRAPTANDAPFAPIERGLESIGANVLRPPMRPESTPEGATAALHSARILRAWRSRCSRPTVHSATSTIIGTRIACRLRRRDNRLPRSPTRAAPSCKTRCARCCRPPPTAA